MAITKTYTENALAYDKSTWTVTITQSNITATGSSFNVAPTITAKYVGSNKGRAQAIVEWIKLLYGSTVVGSITGFYYPSSAQSTGMADESKLGSLASGATATLTRVGTASINTSACFNESNKTTKTVNLAITSYGTKLLSQKSDGAYYNKYEKESTINFGTLCTVTLNVPPTTSYSVASNTGENYYKDVTTVTVTLSDLTAYYDGDFSNGGGATLTIGSQTASRTTNGDLSIRLNATGTFTPILSLKDSRGQTNSYTLNDITVTEGTATTFEYTPLSSSTSSYYFAGKTTVSTTISNVVVPYSGTFTARLIVGSQVAESLTEGPLSIALSNVGTFTPRVEVTDSYGRPYGVDLSPINVEAYSVPNANLEVQRTRPSTDYPTPIGSPDDEGESAVLTTTFVFTDKIASLIAPTVTVIDESGTSTTPTVTWYSSRNETTGAVSGSVNWSSVSSGDTVYGLISLAFNAQESYQITLTPRDSLSGVGETSAQTISTAFYTIDFLAGGHGVAFGQQSTTEGFECDMTAIFHDTVDVEGILTGTDITASGNVTAENGLLQLDTTATSGTDHEIYDALVSIGWDSDVLG